MTVDPIRQLRSELMTLKGPARTGTLLRLGQALADRYWRAGPGQPAALPYLDDGILAVREAYGYFAPSDAWRAQAAGQLGWLHGIRHVAHAGPDSDRETGIGLLAEALAWPRLPQAMRTIALMVLGQLRLARPTGLLRSPRIAAGFPPGAASEAGRAAACFREVLAAPAMGAGAAEAARAMLTVAEALQELAGAPGFDMSRLIRAMRALQDLHARTSGPAPAGMPPMPSLWDGDTIARMDPLDRPVAVVDVPAPRAPGPRRGRPPAMLPDPVALRRELRSRLAGGGDLWPAVLAMLPPAAAPATDVLDDVVALAVAVTTVPGADGADQLLLAVALYLRGRTDPGDWPDDDLSAARTALAAAGTPAVADPAAAAVLSRLGALLGERRLPAR